MFGLMTSRSKGGNFFACSRGGVAIRTGMGRKKPSLDGVPAVHEAKFVGASHYRRRLAYTRFVSFGVGTLVNHVLMQVVKTIDGNYQSGDYFSLP